MIPLVNHFVYTIQKNGETADKKEYYKRKIYLPAIYMFVIF